MHLISTRNLDHHCSKFKSNVISRPGTQKKKEKELSCMIWDTDCWLERGFKRSIQAVLSSQEYCSSVALPVYPMKRTKVQIPPPPLTITIELSKKKKQKTVLSSFWRLPASVLHSILGSCRLVVSEVFFFPFRLSWCPLIGICSIAVFLSCFYHLFFICLKKISYSFKNKRREKQSIWWQAVCSVYTLYREKK